MSKRFRIVPWHGEEGILFYLVDMESKTQPMTESPFREGIEILETYYSRKPAEADAAVRNAEEEGEDHERGTSDL